MKLSLVLAIAVAAVVMTGCCSKRTVCAPQPCGPMPVAKMPMKPLEK